MEKKFKLLPPTMPNFIRVDGMKETVSVRNLTRIEAEEYAEVVKKEFMLHWAKKTRFPNPKHA